MSSECEKVAMIVEQSFWQKLNILSKLRMRVHLMMCKKCTDYKKDSTVLHRILCSFKPEKGQVQLDADEKARLKNMLR